MPRPPLENFTPGEFRNFEKMQDKFLMKLQKARSLAGVPFIITSSYREDDPRSHGRGYAVDIRARDSRTRWLIVTSAIKAGFTRIGIYDRHVHLDDDPSLDPDVIWTGISE